MVPNPLQYIYPEKTWLCQVYVNNYNKKCTLITRRCSKFKKEEFSPRPLWHMLILEILYPFIILYIIKDYLYTYFEQALLNNNIFISKWSIQSLFFIMP